MATLIDSFAADRRQRSRGIARVTAARLPLRLWSALAMFCFSLGAVAQSVGEQQVKAAFVYNFIRFVEWPAHRFAAPDQPILVGVLGSDSMVTSLKALVADRRIGARPIAVAPVGTLVEGELPHVLFVSAARHESFLSLRPLLRDRALLTITDAQPCSTASSHICLQSVGNKLRFEIDMGAADRSQLRVNAQLQQLASAVRRGGER